MKTVTLFFCATALLVLSATGEPPAKRAKPELDIRIIFDNTSARRNFLRSWGFSALIDFRGKRVLFDAGSDPILLLEHLKKMRIDPKTIDHRPPLPSASRRLVRTTPHLPLHPPGHSAARPLDATGVATLHRQPSMVKSACPLGSAPAAPPAPPQGAPGGSGWRALPGRSQHTGRPVTASGA